MMAPASSVCLPSFPFAGTSQLRAAAGPPCGCLLLLLPQSYDNWRMEVLAAAAPPGGGGCFLWVDESARNVGPLRPPGRGGDAAPASFR